MKQTPDAPWIREAERDGFPPYKTEDIDFTPAIDHLAMAAKAIIEAEDHLLCAEDVLISDIRYAKEIRDLFRQAEDLEVTIRQKRGWLKGGDR